MNIHRVPPPMTPLLVCDRGQKTKPKIILAKFCPSLSLGRIYNVSKICVRMTNQEREFAFRYILYLSARDECVLRANSRSWFTYANLWNLILPKLRPRQNFVNMIFALVFCPLSHTKRGVIGGETRCIVVKNILIFIVFGSFQQSVCDSINIQSLTS